MKLRGVLTVACVGISLAVMDVIQRIVITTAVRVRPAARERILGRWIHFMARLMFGICRTVGGARFQPPPRIPAGPGVLVLMNHQSVLDIPVVVAAIDGGYPLIVTRSRYARGKPLISHMVRLYQYPVVDPGATVRGHLDRLVETAHTSTLPIAVFPEGHRSRDGSIGYFKKTGLRLMLGARPWQVYLLVADGLWQTGRLVDFLEEVGSIRGRYKVVGPIAWAGAEGDPDAFLDEVRDTMRRTLSELRGEDEEATGEAAEPAPPQRPAPKRPEAAPVGPVRMVTADERSGAGGRA